MRLATVSESRKIDQLTREKYGVSGESLMEAAGAIAAREIVLNFVSETRSGGILIVCGFGHNGADGLVVARHLVSAGVRRLKVKLLGPAEKRSALFNKQLDACALAGVDLETLSGGELGDLRGYRLIVDALFGTGLSSKIQEPFATAIREINKSKLPVVSLDAPSGLDGDRGVALGEAVRADTTFTFGLAKPGFYISDGPAHVGRLKVLPIGLPLSLARSEARSTFAVTGDMVRKLLPKRSVTGNKSTNGQALVIAGHPGMWGAALLAASSAYRVGAGYVVLSSLEKQPTEVLKTYPEILTSDIDDKRLWSDPKWQACGIGPGLGTNEDSLDQIESLLKRLIDVGAKSVVVDADAITMIAKRKFWPIPESWILTPHAGELSRLLGVDAKTIEGDRVRYAREAAEKLGCHVLLKGFRTVLASKDRAWIILSGNSALAKAGTGDVLTGMITGLLAQGLSPLPAAAAGAYIHGRMADEWVRAGHDRGSLQASDLREFLSTLMKRL